MEIALLPAGLLVVGVVLWDVFQSVVVPRPTPSRWRPAALLVRFAWPMWLRLAPERRAEARDRMLGTFAPLVVVAVSIFWVAGLMFGWALVLFALRAQITPAPPDLLAALYFSGTSLFSIGFGDVVAVGPWARAVAITASASGLGVVALTITYLFSLFASFQRREVLVVLLDERAGSPPSGVTLLETYARNEMTGELGALFREGETWAAEVLDSHVAYPILTYFRSQHDRASWIAALGALLDATTLVLTAIDGVPAGPARLMRGVGAHLVEDLTHFLRLEHEHDAGVERSDFDAARARLGAAGYRVREPEASWSEFARLRAEYAGGLNSLALRYAVPPALWIGDRSPVRHVGRPR